MEQPELDLRVISEPGTVQSSADIEVKDGELRVTLTALSSEHRSKAIASMCEELNRMDVSFPGKLRLIFSLMR